MELPFDSQEELPGDADIVWRRAGEGTYFFIDSKAPEGYRIEGVTSDGKRTTESNSAGFEAVAFVDHPCTVSVLYATPGEAKAACEYHRRFRVFPAPEKGTVL